MIIKNITTKDFGGEVEFTKWLCNEGRDFLDNLFEKCFGVLEDFSNITVQNEIPTSHGKRVDIVAKDNNQIITIESQSATDSLDPMHICKSQYYAYDLDAVYNIVICENSDENLRSYVRYENEHPKKNNFLVEYQILTADDENYYISWAPVVKPLEPKQKKRQTYKIISETTKKKFNNDINVVFSGKFPMEIEATYGGKKYKATLYEDKTVVMETGTTYKSINEAGKLLTGKSSQNAWTFWTYNGESLTTHQLRHEGLTKDDFTPDEWRYQHAPDPIAPTSI